MVMITYLICGFGVCTMTRPWRHVRWPCDLPHKVRCASRCIAHIQALSMIATLCGVLCSAFSMFQTTLGTKPVVEQLAICCCHLLQAFAAVGIMMPTAANACTHPSRWHQNHDYITDLCSSKNLFSSNTLLASCHVAMMNSQHSIIRQHVALRVMHMEHIDTNIRNQVTVCAAIGRLST